MKILYFRYFRILMAIVLTLGLAPILSFGASAQEPLPGAISGIVYDAFGNTVADAEVCTVIDAIFSENCTMTSATGDYIISGLAPGDYRLGIEFSDWEVDEFYDNTYDWNTALWVTVNTGEITTGVDIHLIHGGGQITGYVENYGGGMQVCAVEYDQGVFENCVNPDWFWEYGTYGGYYVIDGLVSGDYRVDLRPLPDDGITREYFNNAFNPQYAARVSVVAGQTTTDINFDLLGSVTVWGAVTDSAFNPIPNAMVCASGYWSNQMSNCAQSASDGTYSMEVGAWDSYVFTVQAASWLPEAYSESADPVQPVDIWSEGNDISFVLESSFSIEQYFFNLTNPILNEPAVRQAIAFGTDRQRILDQAFLPNNNYGAILNSYVPSGHWAQAPSSALSVYPFNPDEARAMLQGAGWIDTNGDGVREKDGQSLSFTLGAIASPARLIAAEIFRQNMADIGIDIYVSMLWDYDYFQNSSGFGPRLADYGIDIAEFAWNWCLEPDDPSCNPPHAWNSGDSQNVGDYSNSIVDGEYAAAQVAVTREEKLPHLVEHQAILSQDLPTLPLFSRFEVSPVTTPAGSNVNVTPGSNTSISFEEVIDAGLTAIVSYGANPADLPPNYQLLGEVYNIGTNATFTNARVCFTYDESGLTPAEESAIRLLQLENNTWVDVTDSGYPDIANNRICGTVTSFLPFATMYTVNSPPEISALTAPIDPTQLGQTIVATVEFSDPDVDDTHSIIWDWGDGYTSITPATVPSISTSHLYTSAGVYTVIATISDAAGESATAAFQYIVIYDPDGGFVTGGGWIDSPMGAYTPNPLFTGKATFGFVSKYQKGANVPTGNTEFQFKVADLNFKSTSYDWLVIAGSQAKYRGAGTINGAGEYGFMLSAIDGTSDKFRIKIWVKATDEAIYDNQLGAADDAVPTTVIGGGSIVIHKEK